MVWKLLAVQWFQEGSFKNKWLNVSSNELNQTEAYLKLSQTSAMEHFFCENS